MDIRNKNELRRRIDAFLHEYTHEEYIINEEFCKDTMRMMADFIGHVNGRMDSERKRLTEARRKLKEALWENKVLIFRNLPGKTYGRYVWNVAHWKCSVRGKWQIIHADAGWLFGGKRVSDSQGDGSDPRNDPEIRLCGRYDRGKAV